MGSGGTDRTLKDPMRGRILGGCRIEERVGRGGMGVVYKARRLVDDRIVALKILPPFLTADKAVVARFERESRAASKVNHPNVVRLLGAADEAGVHYSVMEFVDGENLSELLKRQGRLPLGQALSIAHEIAGGLAALHAEGIVHRDVKPSNVLLGKDGSVKLTDFGIARDINELRRLTATGDLMGTLGFAAPEQIQNGTIDGRADLFALGATLHVMISGIRPPADPLQPFALLEEGIPLPVRLLVDHLLARLPEKRPLHAQDALEKLAPLLHAAEGSVRKPRHFGWLRALSTSFALVLILAAGAAASGGRWNRPATGPWGPLLPTAESWPASLALFSAGTLMAGIAILGGRLRRGARLRSGLGLALYAGAILVSYGAGAAAGPDSFLDPERTLSPDSAANRAVLGVILVFGGLLLAGTGTAGPRAQLAGACTILAGLASIALASRPGPLTPTLLSFQDRPPEAGPLIAAALFVAAGCAAPSWIRSKPLRILAGSGLTLLGATIIFQASRESSALSLLGQMQSPAGAFAIGALLAFSSRCILPTRPAISGPPPSSIRMDGTAFSTPTPTAKPS